MRKRKEKIDHADELVLGGEGCRLPCDGPWRGNRSHSQTWIDAAAVLSTLQAISVEYCCFWSFRSRRLRVTRHINKRPRGRPRSRGRRRHR